MRLRIWISGIVLLSMLVSSPAAAQHVADATAMRHAIAQALDDESNRATILRALEREDVKQMASRFGVDLKDATVAINTLSSAELAELAEPARAITVDEAGGATTVVISITTLLLLLIIVILLVD